MTVVGDWNGAATTPSPAAGFALDRAVASLYGDLRLTPLLHTLLAHSRTLLDGVAGSISVVDADAGTYSKLAERGVPCRLGATFPLDEGATGLAVAAGGPVVIDDYSALTGRHLAPGHPANRGSVVAVPLWWRGELLGVNVAFAGRRERFSAAQLDGLELLTQSAAGAILRAGAGEPSLLRFRDGGRRAGGAPTRDAAHVAAPVAAAPRAAGPDGPAGPAPVVSPLTPREAQVLALVALGLPDREIARRLVLSPKTVEKHVGSAIRKAGATSRTGAAVVGRERGWV